MRQRRGDRHRTEEGREMRQFKFVVFKIREGEKTHTPRRYINVKNLRPTNPI